MNFLFFLASFIGDDVTTAHPVTLCKVTGEPLIQRKDDTAAVLKSRLEAFHRQTEPVIAYNLI